MKKMAGIVCIAVVLLSLTACGSGFSGVRIGNGSAFILDYQMLNETDSQKLRVRAGDTIHASIEAEDGSVSVCIQKEEEDPVYEGKDLSFSSEYDIQIEHKGIYTVTVTGKKAKGAVSFTVNHRRQ